MSEAFDRALQYEIMVRDWQPQWKFATPKKTVSEVLKTSLQHLVAAEASAPTNEELFVLTGLVAHFAYNVDVKDSPEIVFTSLARAQDLQKQDYRTDWFVGIFLCQATHSLDGMNKLLSVEHSSAWEKLPADFWNDYMFCAVGPANMPAHALRAADHLQKLGAPVPAPLLNIASRRFRATDVQSNYSSKDVWLFENADPNFVFTSYLCGISLSVKGDWRPAPADAEDGTCTLQIGTGPYSARDGQSAPTLLVLARAGKPNESFEDFYSSFLKKYPTAKPVQGALCPVNQCIKYEIVSNQLYPDQGGAHLLLEAFSNSSVDFPGIVFEKPSEHPHGEPGKTQFYRPVQKLHRLPGTLYTVVILDSNQDIFEKAAQDFDYLLKSIKLD